MIFFTVGLVGTTTGSILPEIIETYQVSYQTASYLPVVWNAGVILGSTITNYSVRLTSGNSLLQFQCLLIAVALLSMSYTNSYPIYVSFYTILAFACGMALTLGHTIAVTNNLDQISSGLSIAEFSIGVGYLSAPLLFYILSSTGVEWKAGLVVILILPVLISLVHARSQTSYNLVQSQKEDHRESSEYVNSVTLLILLSLIGLASACIHYLEWGQNTWNTIYNVETLGVDENLGRLIFSAFLFGFVMSRFANIFITRYVSVIWLSVISLVLIGISFALYIAGNSVYLNALSGFLLGLGLGPLLPNVMTIVLKGRADLASIVSTIVILCGGIGASLGGVVLGLEIQQGRISELYQRSFLIVLSILAFAIVFLMSLDMSTKLRATPKATVNKH